MSNLAQPQTLIAVDFHGNKYDVSPDVLRWRPSVYSIVIRDGKVLLTHQAKSYNLPGGGIDFGEQPEEAVIRETIEETGIEVTNPRLVACKSNIFKGMRADDVVDFFQSILLFYVCDYTGGKLSIDGIDDHELTWTEMPEWVPIESLVNIKRGSSYEWRDIVEKSCVRS